MKYGCIGEKLSHSFSKIIHNQLYDKPYSLVELRPDEVDRFMTERDFHAINVTIPYKQKVIPYLSFISDEAKKIGAVNTIVNKNGLLYGYNTDYAGMSLLIRNTGIEVSGKKALILGSGGTSKTAKAVLTDMGASEVYRLSRKAENDTVPYGIALQKHTDAEIIINTTPVGMYPNTEGTAIDIDCFPNLSGVIDAVYNPLRTELVSKALTKGIKASGGLLMLVAQAVYAAEYFLDRSFEQNRIFEVYNSIMAQKENIVLIGMPASGKTTLGKQIAKLLSREFADTDTEFEKEYGMTPADVIREKGESEFRKMECETVKKISANGSLVIATGGGVPLNPVNILRLKQNGVIFFIDRDIESIIAFSKKGDRPLSSDEKKIRALYDTRYKIYCDSCDIRITDISAETIVKEFEKWER